MHVYTFYTQEKNLNKNNCFDFLMAFEKNLGENSKQMSVDLGSIFVPKYISNIINEVSKIDDFSQKSSKVKFHIQSLKEEMEKVDAFKRELPHCMHLLKDAIERLMEMEERLQINLKGNFEGGVGAKGSNDISEKKAWMSSAQLWSTHDNKCETKNQDSIFNLKSCEEVKGSSSGKGCNFKIRGGAFVPFKRPSGVTIREEKVAVEVPPIDLNVKGKRVLSSRAQLDEPQEKKQRRCWSPELHNLFVDALEHLGGPENATPKQIRELMNVDGLTNDEVKSHLQKYRLHIRKLHAGSSSFSSANEAAHDPVAYSGSPHDHMNVGCSSKGGSAFGGDSMGEEDGYKFESHGCMGWAEKHVHYHP